MSWRKALAASLVLALCAGLAGCGIKKAEPELTAESYTVTDAFGTEVTIPAKPERIAADSEFLDEMLLSVVPPERLAACSISSKNPAVSFIAEETKDIEKTIPLMAGLSMEDVGAIEPDLIICSDYSDKKRIELWRSMGLPVVVVKGPQSVAEAEAGVRLIAAAAGEKERGEKVVAQMEERLARTDAKIRALGRPRPTALLITQMTSYGGAGSMYDDLLTRAHIDNAITKMGVSNGSLFSLEAAVESDPDLFFVTADKENDETGAQQYRDDFLANPAVAQMRAARHIVPLADKYLYAASQNCVYAVEAMANGAYGPVFDLSEEKNIKGY